MNTCVKNKKHQVYFKKAAPTLLILTFSFSGLSFSGCEATPAVKNALEDRFVDLPVVPNPPVPEPAPECFNDRFTQPEALVTRNLDLLFVTDTSGSLDIERASVAAGIDSFVAALPSQVDYQVAVMLAHGSKSSYSGRLWSASSSYPKVSKSSTMSLSTIRSNLSYNLTHVADDYYSDGGEEGLYSITQGLQGTKLAESQALGFFRADAALAVVFVSDENDICAVYPAGVTPVYDPDRLEGPAKLRDCNGITPETVLTKIRQFQGDRPFIMGAVAYTSNSYPRSGENEYGWGYLDLVQLAQGVSVDMASGQYSQGLSNIGQLTSQKLQLLYDFTLTRSDVDSTTIQVNVDGASADFTYATTDNAVHVPTPGRSRSVVDVSYCLKTPAPIPSSTPTPTPTPTPTASPSPEPSPTSSPSPSPSPTPCTGTSCDGGPIGI